jgi:hypothetical protein
MVSFEPFSPVNWTTSRHCPFRCYSDPYFGSVPSGFRNQALMVLRDRLVRREISDRDRPSRKYILRILPNVAMVITSNTTLLD